jgi:hypothetical protein
MTKVLQYQANRCETLSSNTSTAPKILKQLLLRHLHIAKAFLNSQIGLAITVLFGRKNKVLQGKYHITVICHITEYILLL